MGIFNFFNRPDFNAGIEEWRSNKNAVLLDVRTVDEYNQGHIRGSINIPLQNIEKVKKKIQNLDKVIYVHCLSGSRSSQAATMLRSMGYTNVKNIGGIRSYRGEVAK